MSSKGRLVILSAPSGTGKSSVIKNLLERNPNMIHSVSWTTRPRRGQEVDGKDYHFVAEKKFIKGIEENAFTEWAKVHNSYYGTPKEPLEKNLAKGRDVLLDIDVQGGMNLKKIFGAQAVAIFILPPSETELERRLHARQTDSAEARALRLKNAKLELAFKDRYDHQVVNHDLEETCRNIEKILCSV